MLTREIICKTEGETGTVRIRVGSPNRTDLSQWEHTSVTNRPLCSRSLPHGSIVSSPLFGFLHSPLQIPREPGPGLKPLRNRQTGVYILAKEAKLFPNRRSCIATSRQNSAPSIQRSRQNKKLYLITFSFFFQFCFNFCSICVLFLFQFLFYSILGFLLRL